mmetsp:Transcript_53499/g.114399  ORF Transcript_53499/g.114399 Transcript_53499/m.114399 type:complete len:145 (+) Transcript_53499:28-462(+)
MGKHGGLVCCGIEEAPLLSRATLHQRCPSREKIDNTTPEYYSRFIDLAEATATNQPTNQPTHQLPDRPSNRLTDRGAVFSGGESNTKVMGQRRQHSKHRTTVILLCLRNSDPPSPLLYATPVDFLVVVAVVSRPAEPRGIRSTK